MMPCCLMQLPAGERRKVNLRVFSKELICRSKFSALSVSSSAASSPTSLLISGFSNNGNIFTERNDQKHLKLKKLADDIGAILSHNESEMTDVSAVVSFKALDTNEVH